MTIREKTSAIKIGEREIRIPFLRRSGRELKPESKPITKYQGYDEGDGEIYGIEISSVDKDTLEAINFNGPLLVEKKILRGEEINRHPVVKKMVIWKSE